MISLKKRNLGNRGFTIVELLIVIVVIGILALLVITTYSGIQAKARNAKRQTDIQAIQTQLEAFFSENGFYPSLADMNSSTWLSTYMKSLDTTALTDPSNPDDSKTLLAAPNSATPHQYAYAVFKSDGTTSCGSDTATADDGADCAKYTLTANYEGSVNGQNTYTKSNLD